MALLSQRPGEASPTGALAPPGDPLPRYAELHCLSNFSFQRGASHPEELVAQAYALGYAALAITDECSVAGIVRAHVGLREHLESLDEEDRLHPGAPPRWRNPDFRLLFGSEFDFGRFKLVALARNLAGWGQLCEFITAARLTEPKGTYRIDWATSDLASLRDCELLFVPRRHPGVAIDLVAVCADLTGAKAIFCSKTGDLLDDRLWLAVELFNELDDDLWLAALQQAGAQCGVPLVAAGDVHMHVRSRKALQDVLVAVREGRPVAECGFALQPNAERHLRSRLRLAELYPPPLLANTLEVMRRCTFDPDVIRTHYHYPRESVGDDETPAQALVRKTWAGAHERYPQGVPGKVRQQVEHELALILELKYEMFFLTVEDIVAFAKREKILCQGRGSSANSAVCYCLGITAIDPGTGNLLFERFLSRERREPPDIDVDFEHQRREEVIQYIYKKYGRERAAIAAVVIRYRSRSALRDTGKALGIDERVIDLFAKDHHWFDRIGNPDDDGRLADALRRAGMDPSLVSPTMHEPADTAHDPGTRGTGLARPPGAPPPRSEKGGRERAWESLQLRLRQWLELAQALKGFPRHLSQHVGGFVLTQSRLTQLVPVENAAMKDRSVIQWEKDDLEAMGMLKVDVLALGMLSAIRGALALLNQWRGTAWQMHTLPEPEEVVYDMICDADVVGVFQIESRAQMSMLPRLKPRCYYDLVIEVAIVRPGPIQGGMVHPYLKNREKVRRKEDIHYPYPALKAALGRTLGIPIFQEQVMQIAMIAADFTPDQADRLRRAMAAWKRTGGIDKFRDQLIEGMVAKGYDRAFAEAIYRQCEGFGEYGFPESHAASFAKLVLVSCWLKFHEPACFLAAMLNAQPMGFYSPSQLVQDARRHGVEVRPVDVMVSALDCTLEAPNPSPEEMAVRPGFACTARGADRVQADSGNPHRAVQPVKAAPCHVERQGDPGQPAVRLGLRRVNALSEAGASRLVAARAQAPFTSVEDLALRAELDRRDMAALAQAEALTALAGHRRQQVWEATATRGRGGAALLKGVPIHEPVLALPAAPEGEEIVGDYAALGLTLRRHPLALLRPRLDKFKLRSAVSLRDAPHGAVVRACGIVTVRQRPGTAKGTIFVTLEDETGPVNVIVWRHVVEVWREPLLQAHLLAVQGTWQRDVDSGGKVQHLVAERFHDLTPWLGRLAKGQRSRDFH